MHTKLVQLCWTLCDAMDFCPSGVCQATLSMGFSRQEHWSGLPFPPPWDLLDPEMEQVSLVSLALKRGFFTTSATWEFLRCSDFQPSIILDVSVFLDEINFWIGGMSTSGCPHILLVRFLWKTPSININSVF